MSKSPPPVIVAVVSDLHVGSSFGLCPPNGINLEDGGIVVMDDMRWPGMGQPSDGRGPDRALRSFAACRTDVHMIAQDNVAFVRKGTT